MLKVVCLNLANVKKSDLIEPTYNEGPFNDLGWDYLWLCEDKKIRPHRIEISKKTFPIKPQLGKIPSGNFQYVQFPKHQLPKSSVRPAVEGWS